MKEQHDEFWRIVRFLVENGFEVAVRPLWTKSSQLVVAVPQTQEELVAAGIFESIPCCDGDEDCLAARFRTIELRDSADQPEEFAQGVSGDSLLMNLVNNPDLLRKYRALPPLPIAPCKGVVKL